MKLRGERSTRQMSDRNIEDDVRPLRTDEFTPELVEQIRKGMAEYDDHKERLERLLEKLCLVLDRDTAEHLADACAWDPCTFRVERKLRLAGLERLVDLASGPANSKPAAQSDRSN
ncbi:MAG: hypothetical protein APF80_09895 [Alphaproteobacteria bacterium BRH_c36]|nr:MAG: hypothetical protein APF80_09895 [Alphaproteobacteria bacterium BRH_c36]